MTLNYLNCDSGSEQLEVNFLTYCRTNNTYINASAPYKHQQNFIECFVRAIKNGVRVALLYNKAPFYLWYHAMVYYIHTYNKFPRRNTSMASNPMSALMLPSMLSDMLITRRRIEKIRFTLSEHIKSALKQKLSDLDTSKVTNPSSQENPPLIRS